VLFSLENKALTPRAETMLFLAARAQLVEEVIRPALADGKLVISDRYSDSRYAYQAVTLKGVIPQPEEWIRAMHNGWSIVPDKTFLFVLPIDEALARLKPQNEREHFEKRDVLENVQKNYLQFARKDPSRFVIVDAMKEKNEIAIFVADSIRQILQLSRSHRVK
jgi:dTMP kinase